MTRVQSPELTWSERTNSGKLFSDLYMHSLPIHTHTYYTHTAHISLQIHTTHTIHTHCIWTHIHKHYTLCPQNNNTFFFLAKQNTSTAAWCGAGQWEGSLVLATGATKTAQLPSSLLLEEPKFFWNHPGKHSPRPLPSSMVLLASSLTETLVKLYWL